MKVELDAAYLQILPVFVAESMENLATMEEALLALEAEPANGDAIASVFRVVHTLKGDAAALGFRSLAELAHLIEDGLHRVRLNPQELSAQPLSLLLESVDLLRSLITNAEKQLDGLGDYGEAFRQRVHRWLESDVPAAPTPSDEPRDTGAVTRSPVASRFLRVEVERLDDLLNLVGEMAVARGALTNALEQLAGTQDDALALHRDADRLYLELQELVMKLRMVPVGPAFRRYGRLVRDVATAQDKQVQLVVEGGEVELDSTLLQLVQDPISHMLRNSIVHGLEEPAEREAAGKSRAGVLILATRQQGGAILIEVTDDGRGIDRERVRQRAIELGRIDPDEAITEHALLRLILEPGFTTTEVVSDLSGRGVGMDVVLRNVETLRGTLEVESKPGRGTTLRMILPLTLAIIDGLLVRCAGQLFVLPVDHVMELVDIGAGHAQESQGLLHLRDQSYPCLRVREFLGASKRGTTRENAILVERNGVRAALIVDAIEGKSQVVIKPLSKLFERLPIFSGAAVLGSGGIALILDVEGLLRQAREERRSIAV